MQISNYRLLDIILEGQCIMYKLDYRLEIFYTFIHFSNLSVCLSINMHGVIAKVNASWIAKEI